MDVWDHDGKLYEVNSYYSLPDDAWQYELIGLTGAPGTGPYLAIVIPDVTPDEGPFIPEHAGHALVRVGGGVTPWPILLQLIELAESSGDIVGTGLVHVTADDEILSSNVWLYDGKRFEVNSFYHSDSGAWCYELYEVTPDTSRNDYAEVQILDATPDGGPFVPVPADRVTFTVHGEWNIPWPVFRRFIEVIAASADIVQDRTAGRA